MIDLTVIKTKTVCYIKGLSSKREYRFDGVDAGKTFHKDWLEVDKFPELGEIFIEAKDKFIGFKLIDASMATKDIPLTLSVEDVGDRWDWEKKTNLRSLYEDESEYIAAHWEWIEFQVAEVIEMDGGIKKYKGFSFPVRGDHWKDDPRQLTHNSAENLVIDKICFPEPLLPSRPVSFTSQQSYEIIRFHVQQNINRKFAKISSDYDFHFAVEKIIELPEPVAYKVDVSGPRARKPKYQTRYRSNRTLKVLDISHSSHPWEYGECVKGFEGQNIEELAKKIQTYLDELMAEINKPIKDCPNCKGCGVVQ